MEVGFVELVRHALLIKRMGLEEQLGGMWTVDRMCGRYAKLQEVPLYGSINGG